MCFGGDRVSWQSNAARSLRSLRERPPFAAGGLGPAQGPQKPEGLGALKMHSLAFPGTYFHYFTY